MLLAFLVVLYFAPTLFALIARKRNAGAIIVLNVFGGWTVIGWIGALVWSFVNDPV